MLWPSDTGQQLSGELYAFNLDEKTLRERFIEPYDEGSDITWLGRTIEGGGVGSLRVSTREHPVDEAVVRRNHREYETFTSGTEVTNDWIVGGPGRQAHVPGGERDLEAVVRICRSFDRVARLLGKRHANRETLVINDEYDVQDLMHALLAGSFDDVRIESWNPTYLGGASRVDLLIPMAGIVVEVKMTRANLLDRKVGDQLAEDVTRYSDPSANRGANILVCFIHDPAHLLTNPRGLEVDLEAASNERLRVVGVVG